MQLEELKERYKMLPLWARIMVAAIIGLIPAAYIYFDEGEELQNTLTEAKEAEDVARQNFEQARSQKANLPKREEELAFTEEQLAKAKKSLPDIYRIEDTLQKAATLAKESSVLMLSFKPEKDKEAKHLEPGQYAELPIVTEVEGYYSQVAAFFDRMIHLEGSLFVRKIELSRTQAIKKWQPGDPLRPARTVVSTRDDAASRWNGANPETMTPYQVAKLMRQDVRVKGQFRIVVYRSLSDKEVAEETEKALKEKALKEGKDPKELKDLKPKDEKAADRPLRTSQSEDPGPTGGERKL